MVRGTLRLKEEEEVVTVAAIASRQKKNQLANNEQGIGE
jgi:hypothetical protein